MNLMTTDLNGYRFVRFAVVPLDDLNLAFLAVGNVVGVNDRDRGISMLR